MGIETKVRGLLHRKVLPCLLAFGVWATPAIAPRDVKAFTITELIQIASERGYLDWSQEPVFTIPDEGANHSSRFDADNPVFRDVTVAWHDPLIHERSSNGDYHIYDRGAGAEQNPQSPWGDYMGRIPASIPASANPVSAIQTMTIAYDTRNGGAYSAGIVTTKQVTDNEPLKEGRHVYTVIYVPPGEDVDIEIIGESPAFTLRYDPTIPLPVEPTATPSSTPYPTSTATQTPTHPPTPQPTSTLTPTPLPTDTLMPTPAPSYTPYLQITNTPTSTITPTNTPTNTPPDTATPTRVPTPTAPNYSPTPTATATPTPNLYVSICGYVNALISDDNHAEGDPIGGSLVSLININYRPSNVQNESAINGTVVTTGPDGSYELRIPESAAAQHPEARLRIIGNEHLPMVGPIIDVQNHNFGPEVRMDDVVPTGFNIVAYNHIFRSLEDQKIEFNGENVYITQKLRPDTPWVILDAPAGNSGYSPSSSEIETILNIINEELPGATRGGINPRNAYVIHDISQAPDNSVLGLWHDGNVGLGMAGVALTEEDNHIIYQADFSVNTLRKIREKAPSWTEEEVINRFLGTSHQEIGTVAGARLGYFVGFDPGGLEFDSSVFVEGTHATGFTTFDNNALSFTYLRGPNASPDLNVSMEKVNVR